MSVYINMDIDILRPLKDMVQVYDAYIRVAPDGKCWLVIDDDDLDTLKEYPLVPVPSHGRLIDADALYEDCVLDNGYEVAATTTRINEYMQLKIDAAPTIIPAEESGDGR